jgi:hypothetical protein
VIGVFRRGEAGRDGGVGERERFAATK